MSIFKRPLLPLAAGETAVDFEAALRLIPSGCVLTDATLPGNPIVYVNTAFEAMTGYAASDVIGRNCNFLQGPGSDPDVVAAMRGAVARGEEIEVQILNYRKTGEPFWNELRITPRRDAGGSVVGFIGIQNDVTAKRTLAAEKEQLQERLNAIVENMPGFVFQRVLRRDGTLEFSHRGSLAIQALGMPQGEQSTVDRLWGCIHPDDRQMFRDNLLRSAADLSPLTLEFRIRTDAGAVHWLRTYSKARRNEAGDTLWDGVGVDVTDEKRVEERLSYLAYHDPLTGLANRSLFGTSLRRAMAVAEAAGDRVILLKVDLDSFKEVNELIGQQAGDMILKEIARRISDFAETRHGYAARMGGDEFAVFYATPDASHDIGDSAAALAASLAVPIVGQGEPVEIDASIGSAYFPSVQAGTALSTESELMRRAGVALQDAKLAGRGLHRAYASDEVDRNSALLLRQALRHAIDGGQLRLHYQPLVDIHTGVIVGAEALMRWQHPSLGLLPPSKFIPLAEASGLMVPLGNWLLDEAMRQARAWADNGLTVPTMSLNISAIQLREPSFVGSLAGMLARHGAEARQFELELTEGVMIDSSETTRATLRRLRDAGFGLAVDDFGAGHASFQYLRDFPFGRIKIDQVFIRHMVVESSDASILRAILLFARTLKLDVVAEGIETVEQRDFLRDEGCRIGQGYLYSKPLPPEDFARLLEHHVHLPQGAKPSKRRPSAAAPRPR